jgi:hypothetical protein
MTSPKTKLDGVSKPSALLSPTAVPGQIAKIKKITAVANQTTAYFYLRTDRRIKSITKTSIATAKTTKSI